MPPDNELMLRVREGDLSPLGDLFDRHSGRLFGFLVRLTGRRDVSEDLVQDVFLRILKYRTSFRNEAPFTAWMYQLARNAASDHFTKWKNEHPLDEPDAAPATDDARIHDILVESEEHGMLHRALAKLSADKRIVLLLSRFEDLTYEEIGKIVDAPVGTIKARVHYAMKDLRKEYAQLTGRRSTGGLSREV